MLPVVELPATPNNMLKSGNANVIIGNIVQSSTHNNEAILDNFNKRSNSVTFVVLGFVNKDDAVDGSRLFPPAVIDENKFNDVDDEDVFVDGVAIVEEEVE